MACAAAYWRERYPPEPRARANGVRSVQRTALAAAAVDGGAARA
ncbi:hypothetical protein ABMA10_05885 [Plantibacter sp. RU18]